MNPVFPFLDPGLVRGPGLRGSPLETEELLRWYTQALPEDPFLACEWLGFCDWYNSGSSDHAYHLLLRYLGLSSE